MIFTCTLNPSLDYYLEFDRAILPGTSNRCPHEYFAAGGKGINISIVLSNLSIPSRALGFLGGFTKKRYVELLESYTYLQPNFTYIDGDTRINVKVRDHSQTTNLNAAGPKISAEQMANLRTKISRLTEGDYLCLAGYCQDYLRDEIAGVLKNAIHEGVRVVLDTTGEIAGAIIRDHPFLVKMNAEEAKNYLGFDGDPAACARKLVEQGAENALIIADDHTVCWMANADMTMTCPLVREGEAINSVGVGDSVIAGFLVNYARSGDTVDSFRLGAACGTATFYSHTLAEKEKVDEYYQTAEVTVLA